MRKVRRPRTDATGNPVKDQAGNPVLEEVEEGFDDAHGGVRPLFTRVRRHRERRVPAGTAPRDDRRHDLRGGESARRSSRRPSAPADYRQRIRGSRSALARDGQLRRDAVRAGQRGVPRGHLPRGASNRSGTGWCFSRPFCCSSTWPCRGSASILTSSFPSPSPAGGTSRTGTDSHPNPGVLRSLAQSQGPGGRVAGQAAPGSARERGEVKAPAPISPSFLHRRARDAASRASRDVRHGSGVSRLCQPIVECEEKRSGRREKKAVISACGPRPGALSPLDFWVPRSPERGFSRTLASTAPQNPRVDKALLVPAVQLPLLHLLECRRRRVRRMKQALESSRDSRASSGRPPAPAGGRAAGSSGTAELGPSRARAIAARKRSRRESRKRGNRWRTGPEKVTFFALEDKAARGARIVSSRSTRGRLSPPGGAGPQRAGLPRAAPPRSHPAAVFRGNDGCSLVLHGQPFFAGRRSSDLCVPVAQTTRNSGCCPPSPTG